MREYDYDEAKKHVPDVETYMVRVQSNVNIRDGYARWYEYYKGVYEQYRGQYGERSKEGSKCIIWGADDPKSKYCLLKKGNFQVQYDEMKEE